MFRACRAEHIFLSAQPPEIFNDLYADISTLAARPVECISSN